MKCFFQGEIINNLFKLKKLKKYNIIALLLFLFIYPAITFSQFNERDNINQSSFYFDAICFKSDTGAIGKVDVYIFVPYRILYFEKNEDLFGSQFQVVISVTDSSNKKVAEKKYNKNIIEKDYYITQGGTAKFEAITESFNLPAGKYNVDVQVIDNTSKKEFKHSRSIVVIPFDKYPFSISGIMLLNSIEENNGKYLITPHITDNIGDLTEGFFVFFEAYNSQNIDSVDYIWEIYNKKQEKISASPRTHCTISKNKAQQYLKVKFPELVLQGAYTLRLIALRPSKSDSIQLSDYYAMAERSLTYMKTIGGTVMLDIELAIRQLRYIATPEEFEYINNATNLDDKTKHFNEFWKKHDPTPNTVRNEAFDEYYTRIDYANKNFKAMNEGWLTDMGMVYIIYGPPSNIEKSDYFSGGRQYILWTYSNIRKIQFVDNGMGEYRLVSPSSIMDKYQYSK